MITEQELRETALTLAVKTMRDEKEISSLLERARIFAEYIQNGIIRSDLPNLPTWVSFPNTAVEKSTL